MHALRALTYYGQRLTSLHAFQTGRHTKTVIFTELVGCIHTTKHYSMVGCVGDPLSCITPHRWAAVHQQATERAAHTRAATHCNGITRRIVCACVAIRV